jgi:drug/metabolite transporter (DMT)-like permease
VRQEAKPASCGLETVLAGPRAGEARSSSPAASEPSLINRPMRAREWAMLITLSALWGGSFFFNAIAVKELPPLTIVFLRVGVAAIILNFALALLRHRLPRVPRVWAAFFGMGLLNNAVPFTLFVWGQTHIASGLASILNATTPLFTVVVAHVFTGDEKLTGKRLSGVLLGLAGVTVMIGPQVLAHLGGDALAELACLGAALSYACAGVYGRRFGRLGLAPLLTASGQVTASAILLAPITFLAERPWTLPVPSFAGLGAILGLAIFSTALGYLLYFRLLATAGATNLLLVTFLLPVSTLVLGTLILGERVVPTELLGMGLISLGLIAIDGRWPKRARFPVVRKASVAPHAPAHKSGFSRRMAHAISSWARRGDHAETAALVEGSGGRLTDSVERKMLDRRARSNWTAFH